MSRRKPGLRLVPFNGLPSDRELGRELKRSALGADRRRGIRRVHSNIDIPIQIRTCPKCSAAVKWKSDAMCAASISVAPLSGEAEMPGQIEPGNSSDGDAA